ncbi:MAG: amidohydrolase family protein [Bacteroidota bacterium]
MRINGHAHIFNLQSVLTDEAISIIVNRIRRAGVPGFIADAVEKLLRDQLDHPEYLNEDELLARFVDAMLKSDRLRDAGNLPLEVHTLGGATGSLGVRALRSVLNEISRSVAPRGGPGMGPWDVYETLRVALQPDIPRVAGKLLAHLGPEDALVALMMDITSESEGERDRLNFRRQIRGTQEAVLTHPGRVLPFFAVNPKRKDHFDLMKHAVLEDGFLGIKLYPSLGYALDTAEMRKVLEFCREHDVPITIHTSAGGFKRDDASADFSHPRHWRGLLQPDDSLRVCFAHCGGWGGLSGLVEDQAAWTEQILQLMDDFSGAYADISYHVDQMRSPEAEQAYFAALKTLIDTDSRGDRIVFGTDSWLLRLSLDDAIYWTYFERHLGPERFRKIARDVPINFLGLPVDGRPLRDNIRRHLEWLTDRADEVGAPPAAWITAIRPDVHWLVTRPGSDWSLNNWAHAIAYYYLRNQKPGSDDFGEFGQVRLRQLEYFRRHPGGPTDHLLDMVAEALIKRSEQRARPEGGHDESSIRAALKNALKDPNRTVADIGRLLDAVYLYEPEMIR